MIDPIFWPSLWANLKWSGVIWRMRMQSFVVPESVVRSKCTGETHVVTCSQLFQPSALSWVTTWNPNQMQTRNGHKNHFWLVVSTPLKNISQLGWLFPIYGKIRNVPNHQPDLHSWPNCSKRPHDYWAARMIAKYNSTILCGGRCHPRGSYMLILGGAACHKTQYKY